MAENKNKPEIRFKGFDDMWDERKVVDVAPLQRGFDLPKSEMIVGDYPVVMSNGINGYHSVFKAKAPGVVTGRSGTIGNIHYIDTNYWPHNTALWVTDFKENDPLYIYYMFKKLDLNRFGTGSGVPTLNRNDVHDKYIFIPNRLEQGRIAVFFKHLDTLITQHQRKYDKLVTVKKSMLEKMFPQNGADVPEIRFKGFTEAWEERKWEDTVEISTNMVDPKTREYDELAHIGPGNIESFTGKILDNVLTVKDSNLISGKFHFFKGDIIYGKINPHLGKYAIAPSDGLASADSYILNTKNGVVQNYLYAVLQTKDFYKYSVSVSSRTGMPKINRDELNIFKFQTPKMEEQKKIGAFLLNLDALITLQDCELGKLKNIKKACIEKMFV